MIENIEKKCSSEKKYYYWFNYDGFKEIILTNPYKLLDSEKMRAEAKGGEQGLGHTNLGER